jgi:hypothetical protein
MPHSRRRADRLPLTRPFDNRRVPFRAPGLKIVYCKDGKRKGRYPNVTFDFLGYQFRPRVVRSSRNRELFCSFTPAVSPSSLKAIRSTVRDLNIRQLTVRSLDDIARTLNPRCGAFLLFSWKGREVNGLRRLKESLGPSESALTRFQGGLARSL